MIDIVKMNRSMTDVKKRYILPKKTVYGWSNTHSSKTYITCPTTVEDVQFIVKGAKRSRKSVVGRGAGQSYGDQSLNHGQITIDLSKMKHVLEWDKTTGILRVEAGATFEGVLLHCLKDNWVPAVIPGTRHVTMGGALSNNVHGKNCYAKGNFGEWVREFKIVIGSGEILVCSKEENSDLFCSAIGGAGLLGIVVEVTLALTPIPSAYLSVKKMALSSLEKLLDDLEEASQKSEFAIAQVDCFPQGENLGRGTIHAANFVFNKYGKEKTEEMRNISPRIFGFFPKKILLFIGGYFLNNFTMRLISFLKYGLEKRGNHKAPKVQNIFDFIFFLDKVPNWKKVFKHGFFEYEPLIPKEKVREVVRRLITLTHRYRMPAYLSAIKRHKKDDFLLSYSMDGYSFAMDIPRRPEKRDLQGRLFAEMNKIVMEAGGIVYLAKDAHLTPEEFGRMYKVDEFLKIKKKYDPDELFQSDMYRRIFKKNKMNDKTETSKKNNLLTLDESLDLDNKRANELYKKHVNAGLLGIYELLGFGDMDIESAEGVEIKLKGGRKILDFTSAIGIIALGHNHPKILSAEAKCRDQKTINALKLGPSKLQSALAYNLSQLLPDPLSVSFFAISGAEAVEAALKLCERVQGEKRNKFISAGNSYHGKTHTALSMSRSGHYRDGFIQGIPEENVIEIPYGDISALETVLKERGQEIVSLIVEPMQGQGLNLPPEGYLAQTVELCHKHGVLVIFDEVKAGMSRTGTFCAFQAENVVPDVVTVSKALGGGSRAISAMITSVDLFKKAYGKREASGLHTTTFGGLGHSCAVAIEALNILSDPEFQKSVREKGEYLKTKLEDLQNKYPNQIKDIKGKGLLQGIQFNFRNIFQNIKLEIPNVPLVDTYEKAMMAALVRTLYEKHGILAHFADSNIDTLHIMPPLIVEREHLDKFVDAIDLILENGLISLATNFVKEVVKDKLA